MRLQYHSCQKRSNWAKRDAHRVSNSMNVAFGTGREGNLAPALGPMPHLASALWLVTASCRVLLHTVSSTQCIYVPGYIPESNACEDFKDSSQTWCMDHRKQQYGMAFDNMGSRKVYNGSLDNWTRDITSLCLSFLINKMGTMISISLSC